MMKTYILPLLLLIVLSNISSMETINLSKMSLDEKIGQLMIVKPSNLDINYLDEIHIGGIFLSNKKSKDEYRNFTEFYANNSKIKLFIAADMEGYWNPFSDFYSSKYFSDIKDSNESYNLGKEHGKILNELGFNLDFSPVVEVRNNIWPGRSFTGTDKEISEKISRYIGGLHSENIMATAKHYPGGSLVKNPHWITYKINATKQDLQMFDSAIKNNVDFIMVGHPIISGELDSNKKPATISPEIIFFLKEKFNGIIITDDINMIGLKLYYLFNFKKIYPDLILAGNDVILDSSRYSNYNKLIKRRNELKKFVLDGKISRNRIDESVKKILEKKGYQVIT